LHPVFCNHFSDISLADALALNSYACRFLESILSSYKLSIGSEPFSFSFDLNEYCLRSIVDSSLISYFSNVPFGLVLIIVDFFSSLFSECFSVYLHFSFVNLATVVTFSVLILHTSAYANSPFLTFSLNSSSLSSAGKVCFLSLNW
jgi:hypothetical protein